jgi:hypothetical protein
LQRKLLWRCSIFSVKHRRSPIWISQSTENGLKKSLLWTMRWNMWSLP